MQRSALCRSRREPSNAYYHLLAKCGFDTAENEPCEVCPIERCNDGNCTGMRGCTDHFGRPRAIGPIYLKMRLQKKQ